MKAIIKTLDQATAKLAEVIQHYPSHSIDKRVKELMDDSQQQLLHLFYKLKDYEKEEPLICKQFNETFKL